MRRFYQEDSSDQAFESNQLERKCFSLQSKIPCDDQPQENASFNPFRTLNMEQINSKDASDALVDVKPPTLFSSQVNRASVNPSQLKPASSPHIEGVELLADSIKKERQPSSDEAEEAEQIGELPGNNEKKSLHVSQNSEMSQRKQETFRLDGFFKLLLTKRIILNFKEHLMQQSYMMPTKLSHDQQKLLEEDYLTKQKKRANNQAVHAYGGLLQPLRRGITHFIIDTKQPKKKFKVGVLDPGNKVIVVWELLKIFLILLVIWWAPFEVSFGFSNGSQVRQIQNFLLVFFGLDVVVKLNKGFITQGLIIKQRNRILKNYLGREAFSDIVSLCCLGFLFYEHFYPEVIVFVYIFFNASKINEGLVKIQESFYFQGTVSHILDLVKLVIVIFSFAHVIACVWNYVGTRTASSGTSWIVALNLQAETPWTKYNYSFYWATMTMVTVGYGDITPTNNYELIVANITMFVACGVFAFSVNSIGIVLHNINEGRMKFKRTLTLINNYMNHNAVGFELQSRVRNYLEYCFIQEREMNDEETTALIGKLSTQLRKELLYQVLSKMLKGCEVISANFSEETQRKLALFMEPLRFCPEDRIITDLLDDGSLFIVQKGEVTLFEETSKKKLRVLHKGDSFGEVGFFTGRQRACSISSHGFSRIYKIRREVFLEVIKENQKELQTFHSIKDSILYQNNYEPASLKCYFCGKRSHLLLQCPALRYIPDLERVIKKEFFHSFQERDGSFQRRPQLAKIHKSLANMKHYQDRSRLFKDSDSEPSEKSQEYTYSGMASMMNVNEQQKDGSALESSIKPQKLEELNEPCEMTEQDNDDSSGPQVLIEAFTRRNNVKTTIGTASFQSENFAFGGAAGPSVFGQQAGITAPFVTQALPQRRGKVLTLLGEEIPAPNYAHLERPQERRISLLVPDAGRHNSQLSQGDPISSHGFDSSMQIPRPEVKPRPVHDDAPEPVRSSPGLHRGHRHHSKQKRTTSQDDKNVQFEDDSDAIYTHIRKVGSHVSTKISQMSYRRASSKKTLNTPAAINKRKSATNLQLERQDSDEEYNELFDHDMDKVQSYKQYLPHNNVDVVCKKFSKVQHGRLRQLLRYDWYQRLSKYTFFSEVKRRMLRLKQYLKSQEKQGMDSTAKIKSIYRPSVMTPTPAKRGSDFSSVYMSKRFQQSSGLL